MKQNFSLLIGNSISYPRYKKNRRHRRLLRFASTAVVGALIVVDFSLEKKIQTTVTPYPSIKHYGKNSHTLKTLSVVDEVLDNLKDDGIIIIKEENGELEIYSGYKHDPKTTP